MYMFIYDKRIQIRNDVVSNYIELTGVESVNLKFTSLFLIDKNLYLNPKSEKSESFLRRGILPWASQKL